MKDSSINIVEILVVGNELLNGTVLDTNSHWLSVRITALGGFIARKITIRDDLSVITDAVKDCLSRKPGWLFCLGGLGPTYDDMTLDGVANALGIRTRITKESVAILRENVNRRRMRLKLPKVRRISKSSLKS